VLLRSSPEKISVSVVALEGAMGVGRCIPTQALADVCAPCSNVAGGWSYVKAFIEGPPAPRFKISSCIT
jgi:hypothetical protein